MASTSWTEVKRLCDRRAKDLLSARADWEPVWRDIRDYFCPDVGAALDNAAAERARAGARRNDVKIINTEPVICVDQLAAGLQGGLTPPWAQWFRLGLSRAGRASHAVRMWLDDVERVLGELMAKSDFYNGLHSMYRHLTFGTGAMVLTEDAAAGMAVRVFEPGTYALACGADGRVDSLYRTYPATTGQMVDEFGLDAVPPEIAAAYRAGNLDAPHEVRHLIEPDDRRMELAETRAVWKGSGGRRWGWRSVYWTDGGAGSPREGVLAVRGFRSNPIVAPRWDIADGTYGVGPGKKALGDGKELQKLELESLKALAKSNDPPLAAPAGLKSGDIHTMPGGVTHYAETGDSAGRNPVFPLYTVPLDIEGTEAKARQVEGRIRKAFFVDMFLALTTAREAQKVDTAYEASKLVQERMLMIGPVLERLHVELLDRCIDRAWDIADALGFLPPPPEELEGEELRVEYISSLAQAQKAAGLANMEHFVAVAGRYAQADAGVLDAVDFEAAAREAAAMLGVPEKILRTAAQARARQEARARAQAEQAAAEQARQLGGTVKDLGAAKVGGGTMLDALTGAG